MRAPSLRLRLLLLSAATVAVALLLAGIFIATIFSNHVERNLRAQLVAQFTRLTALVDIDAPTAALTGEMADPRYDVPAGGLYWQIDGPTGEIILRSRSLWDDAIPALHDIPPQGGFERITDPAGLPALAYARQLAFDTTDGGSRQLVLTVAERTDSIDAANAAFRDDLLLALAVLGVALFIAAALQIQLGLRPLDAVQRGIAAIRSGRSESLSTEFPIEVMPLVNEVNELLDVQQRSIGFARERASDLAHGLKTSLTLLNGEAHALRIAGSPDAATRIEELAQTMLQTVDHQLRLSRLRHRTRSQRQSTPVAETAARVIETLRRTPGGARLDWQLQVPADLSFALDRMDLTELLGVLLENAEKWAKSVVIVSSQDGVLRIEDDGPGVPEHLLGTLSERGTRADQSTPGSGLGLAIAHEIVTLNAGALRFGRADAGGLRVEVSLP